MASPPEHAPNTRAAALDLPKLCRAFLAQPGPSTGPLQCFIVRSRGAARLYPRYSLYLDVGHKFLMAARKRKKSKASNYVMSLDEKVCAPGTLIAVLAKSAEGMPHGGTVLHMRCRSGVCLSSLLGRPYEAL